MLATGVNPLLYICTETAGSQDATIYKITSSLSSSSSSSDQDGDGIPDSQDSYPTDPSQSGVDADSDGMDDAIDPDPTNPDTDGDGVQDGSDSNPTDSSVSGVDNDSDGVDDAIDSDPNDSSVSGVDADSDGMDDAIDPDPTNPDTDGDGVQDGSDSNPTDSSVSGVDNDSDGVDDAVDPDPNDPDNPNAQTSTPSQWTAHEAAYTLTDRPIILEMEVVDNAVDDFGSTTMGVRMVVLDERSFSSSPRFSISTHESSTWSSASYNWMGSGTAFPSDYTKNGSIYEFTLAIYDTGERTFRIHAEDDTSTIIGVSSDVTGDEKVNMSSTGDTYSNSTLVPACDPVGNIILSGFTTPDTSSNIFDGEYTYNAGPYNGKQYYTKQDGMWQRNVRFDSANNRWFTCNSHNLSTQYIHSLDGENADFPWEATWGTYSDNYGTPGTVTCT